MAEISDKHRAWIELVVEEGMTPRDAYMKLYPDAQKSTASVEASRMKKKYAKLIFESVKSGLDYMTPKAMRTLEKLMSGSAPDGVKLKAAQAILGYGGFNPAEKKEIAITDRTDSEINTRLEQILGKEEAGKLLN